MICKEISEILPCDAHMDVVIHLNGHAYTVAFPDAEASAKDNIILQMMLCYGILQKLYNFRRAFEVTSAANANLDD